MILLTLWRSALASLPPSLLSDLNEGKTIVGPYPTSPADRRGYLLRVGVDKSPLPLVPS